MAPGVEAPEAITRQTGFHASFIASKLCSDCSAGRSLCQTGQPWKSNRGRQRIGPVPAPPVPAPPVVVPGASGVDRKGPRQVRPLIQQGIISHFFDALCFPEWDSRTNLVTYRLYRRSSQEHITRIERIPDSLDHPVSSSIRARIGLSRPSRLQSAWLVNPSFHPTGRQPAESRSRSRSPPSLHASWRLTAPAVPRRDVIAYRPRRAASRSAARLALVMSRIHARGAPFGTGRPPVAIVNNVHWDRTYRAVQPHR
jgi:hypothetical protein